MKKICSIILAVIFVISSMAFTSFASDYTGHWAESIIDEFVRDGIISGDNYGNFNPDNSIRRAEFVKVINKYYGFTDKAETNFKDVSVSKWYADEFLIAKAQGYIAGDDTGYANPEGYLTRAEVCVILTRLLKLSPEYSLSASDADSIPDWAKGYVGAAKKAGYIKGYADGSLRVNNNITRAEAVSLISRTENEEKKEEKEENISDNLGNASSMTQPSAGASGGGGGGGGGGGSISAPTGTVPAKIDVRNFDAESYVLELTAQYISEFVFTIKAGNQEFTYDADDISPISTSGGYKFETEDIILKTVMARGINGENFTIYVKGIAEAGKADTNEIQIFSDIVTIPLPAPDGLKAAYNTDLNGGYNSNEYLLEWNVVSSATEYKYELYNSKEEGAIPVTSGVILKSELPGGAVTVSKAVAIDAGWGSRDNLYFVVSAKDEQTGIYSSPSEEKMLLLDAPVIEDVVYLSNDKYEIQYNADVNASSYEVKVAGNQLGNDNTYNALDGDVNLEVTIKAFYTDNETITGKHEFCFGYAGGNGKDEPYIIENERHFKNISANLNSAFLLNNDLTLSAGYQSIAGFSGTLNGDNKTVTIGSASSPAAQGIFASVGNGAVIENLVINGKIAATDHAGALAGIILNNTAATIKNCINLADVSSSASNKRVGGFVGSGYDGDTTKIIAENCINYGSVTCGGSNASAGGIAGIVKIADIKHCSNYGIITGPNRAGGIIGYSSYGSFSIKGCANFGNIVSGNTPANAGGIVGHMDRTTSCSVTDCYNGGTAYSGIVAILVGATVSNCVNTGTVTNAIADTETIGNYCLEGAATNALGATMKTSAELKTMELNGYEIKDNYDYQLPLGITYMTKSDFSSVTITTAAEFQNIANDPGGSYKLANDINLNDINYTSISGFAGTLDGKGYTITIGTEQTPAAQGLFASLSNGAVIKNLTVDGSISSTTANVGGIAGDVTVSAVVTVSNCTNLAKVFTSARAMRAGGIIGSTYLSGNVALNNCVNYGDVKSTGWGNSASGGIVGMGTDVSLNNCVNYGNIHGELRTGGMIGWIYIKLAVDGCANFGTMTSANNGAAYINDQHGGIVGIAQPAVIGEIKNSYNGGTANAGMIKITASSISIVNCINTGVTVDAIATGVTAETDCYALSGSFVNSNDANVKTSDELKAINLNGFELKTNYDYPLPIGITYNPTVSGN